MLDPEIKEIQITRYQKCIFGTLALDIFLNNSLNLKACFGVQDKNYHPRDDGTIRDSESEKPCQRGSIAVWKVFAKIWKVFAIR